MNAIKPYTFCNNNLQNGKINKCKENITPTFGIQLLSRFCTTAQQECSQLPIEIPDERNGLKID